MPCYVAFVRYPVDGFGNDFAGAADHGAVGIFAFLSRPHRKRDTTDHHLPIEFVSFRTSHAEPIIGRTLQADDQL
jgi:hypothetical protein